MQSFFRMTCEIGQEIDKNTSVITLAAADKSQPPRVLDIGMAPGGFAQTVLRKHRDARIWGITLPSEMGGLKIMLPRWRENLKVRIEFADITMLANEMGRPATSIPTNTQTTQSSLQKDRSRTRRSTLYSVARRAQRLDMRMLVPNIMSRIRGYD
jgi:hypothetical protein